MPRIENASNNIEEILLAVIEGKKVQYKSPSTGEWVDVEYIENVLMHLELEWRVKPDTFQEVYNQWLDDSSGQVTLTVNVAKHFWNAAIEHKDDTFPKS